MRFVMPYSPKRPPSRPPTRGPGARCQPSFVDGTNQANPRCRPFPLELAQRCQGTICPYIFPGSQYDTPRGRQFAAAELQRATQFYGSYCIDLNVRNITFDPPTTNALQAAYAGWFAEVLRQVGGAGRLGRTSISDTNRANFAVIMRAVQEAAGRIAPRGEKLVVVFVDEYIGGSDGRDTLVSSCQEDLLQVGINWIDRASPFILAHELIHALGKPASNGTGLLTWVHSSNCRNALSRIRRTSSRRPVNLANRLLDVQEYLEIGRNLGAGTLRCRRIP
jgi:hypothetical protein